MKFVGEVAVLVLACVAGGIVGSMSATPDRIVVLSVGQGDCALIQSEGRAVLIDVGPNESGQKTTLAPHLERFGVTTIDSVLLSHPDADHIGDLAEVHRAYPQAPIIAPASFQHDAKLTKAFKSAGISQVYWVNGAEGSVGRFQIIIRCPNYKESNKQDDNKGSMFVRLAEGSASYVTSGDAPAVTEEEMEREGNWQAEVLHVGHHGSRFSTSDSWLKLVRPEMAVVSCGLGNRYGHPNPEVVARLSSAKVPLYRTDTMGDIELDVKEGRFIERPAH